MLLSFLKIAFRHYGKNRLYALLNLLGLVTAYLTVFLILQYLYVETHYEHLHDKADRIFRVTHHSVAPNGTETHWARTYLDFVNELPNEIPEVEHLIRFQNHQRLYLRVGEEKFRPRHTYTTDPEVFEVFGFELIQGDPERALAEPHSLVLTESLARTYFGDEGAMGQQIMVVGEYTDEEVPHTVRGIMADPPAQTHLPVEVFRSYARPEERSWWAYAYVQLTEGAHAEEVEAKLPAFIEQHQPEGQGGSTTLYLQPLPDIHLNSHLIREIVPNGNLLYVRVFAWVGLFVLLIAMVNSLNLSAALAIGRGREVGMHLVLGANRGQILRYSLSESLLYHLFAASLGILGGYFLLPVVAEQLDFVPLLGWPMSVGLMLGLALVAALLVGWYPARILSRMAPRVSVSARETQRGGSPHRRTLLLRRTLVGVQFAAAFLLMASAWIGRSQIRYLQEKDLGMNISQVLALPALPNPVTDKYLAFRDRVQAVPGVESFAACMEVPSREIRDVGPTLIVGQNQDKSQAPLLDMQVISPDFLETMQMELVAGEDRSDDYRFHEIKPFSEEYTPAIYLNEQPRKYLINETAMHKLGWEEPRQAIGQAIQWSIGGFELAPGPITGVVKDVHQESLRNQVDPTVMVVEQIWLRTFLIRLNTTQLDQTIAGIEGVWNELFPTYVMEVEFLDELFNELYQQDRRQLALLWALSGLAIVIALLGLFSLLAYALQIRMKEIAIRRIVGASWPSLIWLLGKEYIWLLLGGAALAIPLSYWLLDGWLAEFAYRVEISPLAYALTLGGFAGLILLTVAFQTLRNSRRRPAEVLREG